jgi:hypothetical protein
MKRKLAVGLGGLVVGCLGLAAPQDAAPAAKAPAVVVGTFDSRAIATAWIRSKAFGQYLNGQRGDIGRALERAKSAGDLALAAQLAALGPAMQRRGHEQGFGTAPVDEILARVQDRLPAVAKQAGVDVIVSKWTLTWRSSDARFVDVTGPLVALFEPDEKTLEVIRQLIETEPLPPERIEHDR